jgi:hypothetical protein
VTIALALLWVAAPAAAAPRPAEAHLLWLPPQTTAAQLARAGLSPGLMSAGLGTVPPNQTYLDVGQGNRVFDSLYETPLPRLGHDCERWTAEVEARAEGAPADIVPFLLVRSIPGLSVSSEGRISCPFGGAEGGMGGGFAKTLWIEEAALSEARRIARRLRGRDLLVAIARPTGTSDDPLPIGIAGRGFDGNLTSDSTRMDGYVLSTDVAPTILGRLAGARFEMPPEISGQSIRSVAEVDVAALESLDARMGVISARRGPVIGLSAAVWLAALLLAALVGRGRWLRPAVRIVGLCFVYLPLVLLLGAAIEPSRTAEQLLVILLTPLLAAGTLAALGGYGALAAASGLTVLAYAVDVVAGSPLTSLSLLGPNPGLGVRFYGIGNELEALLAVLVLGGTGAGLTAFAAAAAPRRASVAFLGIGLLAAAVFAAGRFGADVGAAIVFPAGAIVAAMTIAGRGRRGTLAAIVAAPFAALALLALVDLLSGAEAHLTRSVLDAGGLGELADVAQRRLQLSARSFTRTALLIFLPVVLLLATLAVLRRDRVARWVAGLPAMRAGLLGALAATVVGTLANDSGALVLEVGTAYLLVFTAFAWAEAEPLHDPQTKSYNDAHHKSHPAP